MNSDTPEYRKWRETYCPYTPPPVPEEFGDWRFVLREGEDEAGAVAVLLGELNARLKLSMGGWEGTMLLAATVAFFAGPELFRWRGEFPGIFISGEKGGGKTFMARWLMGLMGYATLDSGIGVLNSTPVGLQIASGQSANMPCWADEYRDMEAADGIRKTLHAGYNRELPVKWAGDGRKRTIRTNFLVTGETSIGDAATMSRYISVVMSREKRQGTDAEQRQVLAWLVANREMLFAIGRVVMRQRAQFAALVRENVVAWENAPDLSTTEPRGRYIHGVVMGAALALNAMVPFMAASEMKGFRAWMREHCSSSEKAVSGQVNVNEFWTDLLAAQKGDAFGETSGDMRRIFKVVEERMPHPPGAPHQTKKEWLSVRLYFLPDPVLDMLRLYKRRMGQELALGRNDLRAQMSARPYWVSSPNGGIHKQKFESGGGTECCWCIELDKHELGYCPVPDAEYEASWCVKGEVKSGEFFDIDVWVDPRRGDMYALIDRLKKGAEEKK